MPKYVSTNSKFHNQRALEACKVGRHIDVKSALASGADPNLVDIYGEPMLHIASRANFIEIIRTLIAFKANVDAADKESVPLIRKCCKEGWIEPLKVLLTTSVNIHIRDQVGDSLLHLAAARGRKGTVFLQVAQALLNAGLPTGARNERGEVPLHHAARYGGPRMTQLLLTKTPTDLIVKDHDGYSAIHAATLGIDSDESLRVLLAAKANPNEREDAGQTPLHLLAALSKTRSFDIIRARTLIGAGANLWYKDLEGLNPYERAQRGRAQMREIDSALINLLKPKGIAPMVGVEAPMKEKRVKT